MKLPPNFEAAVLVVEKRLRAVAAESLDSCAIILADRGATPAEVAAGMALHREHVDEWLADALAFARRLLSEPDAPSHSLH